METTASPRTSKDTLPREEMLRALGWASVGVTRALDDVLKVIQRRVLHASRKAEASIQADLDVITASCLRGRSILQTLVDFSQEPSAPTELVDLNQVAREIFRLLPFAPPVPVGVLLDLSPDVGPVAGEEAALKGALIDLLANSLATMHAGGVLTLRTRNEGPDLVTLTIQDTGEGVSWENLVCTPQPLPAVAMPSRWRSVGMTRVQETVRAHRGTVTFCTEQITGTYVRIEFPRAAWAQERSSMSLP